MKWSSWADWRHVDEGLRVRRICAHHLLALKVLWNKFLEILRVPIDSGLFGVHMRCSNGLGNQHAKPMASAQDSLERCDLGVKTAALAALGEIAALRDEGVADPLVLACSGVKDGESTLNLFLVFSFWFNLRLSCM